VRVALIVDNPYRDLPGIVLVAKRLCEHGATCYLVPTNLEWREVGALAPDFVLLTNIRRPRQEFAERLLEAGMRVGVLETEGGVMPNFDTYTKMTGPNPELFRRLSCFCTWGPKVADLATTSSWYGPHQVVVTGAPRFDFYSKRWHEAALRASSALDTFRPPIILVNGSFPRANPRFLTPEQEIQSWAGLGFTREYMLRFQAIERQALHEMAAVANHLASAFPDATVVYRPHPFERVETYDELLDKRTNLKLLKIGTVEGWILRSAVIVHRNSTTAIEAAMAGRPALLPTWMPVAETLEACDAVSVKCATLDALDAQVGEALADRWTLPDPLRLEIDRVVHDWFHRVDGASHERVAGAILPHVADRARGAVNLRACRFIHHGWRPGSMTLRSRAAIRTRVAFGVPFTWSFTRWTHCDPGEAWAQSEKCFDVARVLELIDAVGVDRSRVTVERAGDGRDYCLPYRVGRSVVMRGSAGDPPHA
jgi:surface carbohydrate biosynthesis protein